MIDTTHPAGTVRDRVDATDWAALTDEIAAHGSAPTRRLLTPAQCPRTVPRIGHHTAPGPRTGLHHR
ncbi:hypothetical protein [Streptomyces sp. NPDC001933]|uniref:hypothetical protein n=1 Tax=Streptomyces sp. NPDC001933 TaxID=3364626 RepID=UPI0036B9998E